MEHLLKCPSTIHEEESKRTSNQPNEENPFRPRRHHQMTGDSELNPFRPARSGSQQQYQFNPFRDSGGQDNPFMEEGRRDTLQGHAGSAMPLSSILVDESRKKAGGVQLTKL